MCLYSRDTENKKYIPNKKNGGVVPAISDIRKKAVPIGCGRCMVCRKQRARGWQIRLMEDVRQNKNGINVTLTFSNETIIKLKKECEDKITRVEIGAKKVKWKDGYRWVKEYRKVKSKNIITGYQLDNAIAKLGMKRFLERWRKEYGKSVRHWLVTELGHNGTENIHMHGIIWTDKGIEKIRKHWQDFVWPRENWDIRRNYVSERTVNYMIKYIYKMDSDHREYSPIILNSAGIGKGYLDRIDCKENMYKGEDTKESYTSRTGHEMAMPKYLRNKIYSEEEREELWMMQLDKGERWVCGEKVEGGIDEENKLKEYYRAKNKRLGYGSGTVDEDRKKEEIERRIIMMRLRTGEANAQDSRLISYGRYEEVFTKEKL